MKKQSELRMMLGISQQEMATLLGVSRSQVALYETGRRQMPIGTTTKLAALFVQIQAQQKQAKSSQLPQDKEMRKHQLEKLLHENQYQQLHCERQMAAALKKHDATAKVQQLSNILTAQIAKDSSEKAVVNLILAKASRGSIDDQSAYLLQLDIRLEVLNFERELLERKLREHDG
ncbi:MAG TPA: helix-turn-helix transcriptional regulator [Flavobacterium sp.]|jgi:transcriptional regulator with XRE-family HTH domain